MSDIQQLKPHVLKVHDVGDHHRKKVSLAIRLEGRWLSNAGLCAESYVQVTNPQPGILLIQRLETQASTIEQSGKTALNLKGD